MSDYSILAAYEMIHQGCSLVVAENVKKAMEGRPEDETLVLWLRMQGRTYREIGDRMGCSRMTVYRIVNNTLRNTVYSIIERAVMCTA